MWNFSFSKTELETWLHCSIFIMGAFNPILLTISQLHELKNNFRFLVCYIICFYSHIIRSLNTSLDYGMHLFCFLSRVLWKNTMGIFIHVLLFCGLCNLKPMMHICDWVSDMVCIPWTMDLFLKNMKVDMHKNFTKNNKYVISNFNFKHFKNMFFRYYFVKCEGSRLNVVGSSFEVKI